MKSDNIKKITLTLCFIMAIILFFALYLNGNKETAADLTGQPKQYNNGSGSEKDTKIVENKSVYNDEKPGEYINVYISVFPTLSEEGKLYDLSSFDLSAYWETNNPVLDASIQFLPKDIKADDYIMRIPNATIRVRGNRGASPKSYKVKILDGVYAYRGQAVFNLNKNLRDPSRIANKLAHDIIKTLDNIAGFRTDFFNVFIKDALASEREDEFYSYGLYTHIEQPNRAYLRAHGLDEKGSIYRAENFNFQLVPQLKDVTDPDYSKQEFETVLAIREGTDHSKLLNMLKDLNDSGKDFNEVFHTYFNEENYLTWLAVNIILGNADAASNGFLLYNPSNLPVWYFLPWDFDGIFLWMKNETELPGFLDKINDVTLHKKYLEQDGNLEKLRDKVNELALGPFSSKKVKSLIKSYKPVLLELMNSYPDNISLGIPINTYMACIDRIDEYIMNNYREFIKWYEEKAIK